MGLKQQGDEDPKGFGAFFSFLRGACVSVVTGWLFPAVVLAVCLFGSAEALRASGAVSGWIREVELTFRDAQTQWMVFGCLAVYLVTFLLIERQQGHVFQNPLSQERTMDGTTGRDLPTRCAGERRPTQQHGERTAQLYVPTRLERSERWGYPRGFLTVEAVLRAVRNRETWLVAGLGIAAMAYAVGYDAASKSIEALMLFGGVVLGKGALVWARWSRGSREDGGWSKEDGRRNTVVRLLTVLLTPACLWQVEEMQRFQYRGGARWNGPWENPNLFGMLMGVGVVLALGQLLWCWRKNPRGTSNPEHRTSKIEQQRGGDIEQGVTNIEHRTSNVERRTAGGMEHPGSTPRARWCGVWRFWFAVWPWARAALRLGAAGVMGWGLLNSYSRGAWVATLCGLGYLAWVRMAFGSLAAPWRRPALALGQSSQASNRSEVVGWLRRNWGPLAVILVSVVVLSFWNFRDTEWRPARRAFSVGNVNDFSWRNRVAAWEGALQIMAEHPWRGVGWTQPQRVFDHYYLPFKMEESAAIQLNDPLMLGMTLGLPALGCFAAYVLMALFRRAPFFVSASRGENANPFRSSILHPLSSFPAAWLRATCRAGAVVLLVAFCFDGGLFKLPTGMTFWILLELGREE